ncbi:N-(5'-phosphoribosyl)anthranilate isomerase [Algimonas arctica]|uniref:N-(5'-phosphoribosyl)anthranilate isomerase n=1 Tax=Algimonas arctica TaxID=1479486 RepID=A0A8J3CKZ1_9PROT|nr:phosphoribosylanthranilate isomerase [Algimonas arctica]GHA83263.1 N-(5'-phosphoribosyl)anthranilate isomerase [Algimonas arctica]
MDTQVKICGLTRAGDVAAAEQAGANFLGFIVEATSSRKLTLAEAAALITGVKAHTVAVTVDPDDALVDGIKAAGFSHIQLHGSETLARTAEIARRGLIVIKAVPVASADDVTLATEYSGAADLLLFDAKAPKGDTQRGGHGLTFDWSILGLAPTPKTFILAGGLTPHNVREAALKTRASIVDVASGVEASPGIKDATLINAFMEQLRG